MSKGNYIAFSVLILWPLISLWLYRTKSIQLASLWIIIGGFMFLPVKTNIDFPLIPPLGKHTMPTVAALIGIWLVKGKVVSFRQHYGWMKILLFAFLMSPLLTVYLNGDPINVGGRILPGLTIHDAISTLLNQWLFIVPLLIGYQFFRTYDQQLLMFKTLVTAGLIYSLLILFEIRMSPQLHSLLYGYFPSSFAQQKRMDGFRAVVFMGHGLWVAFFAMIISLAATALWKNGVRISKLSPAMVSYYLLGVLVLCKSMASLIYGLFAYVLIRYTSTKTQFRLALFLAMMTLFYPTMSILKIFPHQEIVDLAGVIDKDRAGSLMFRFNQEAVLVEHGAERFFFGWGGWGRNRVINDTTGEDESVTDGRWIIRFGVYGWIGFLTEFGMLAIIVFRAYMASKIVKNKQESNLLAAHAILVSLIMLDQLPNASLQPWLWLVAGVLLGRSEDIISKNKSISTL